MIRKLIDEIYTWENRISFILSECSFTADADGNSVILQLTYVINKTNVQNTFKRKIRF